MASVEAQVHLSRLPEIVGDFISWPSVKLRVASYTSIEPEMYRQALGASEDFKMLLNFSTSRNYGDHKVRYLDAYPGMHYKFIVRDDHVLWGSWNFFGAGQYDIVSTTKSKEFAEVLNRRFDEMWIKAKTHGKLLTKEQQKELLLKVVEAQKGWDKFTTGLNTCLRRFSNLTEKQLEALHRSYRSAYSVEFVPTKDIG